MFSGIAVEVHDGGAGLFGGGSPDHTPMQFAPISSVNKKILVSEIKLVGGHSRHVVGIGEEVIAPRDEHTDDLDQDLRKFRHGALSWFHKSR